MDMVRKLVAFLLLIISPLGFAVTGQIISLDVPIFKEPNKNAKILEYKRKGERIFIHSQEIYSDHFKNQEFYDFPEVDKNEINELVEKEKIYLPANDSQFYKTIAKTGAPAYILKEHVLIIYKDKRELTQKKSIFDNTDYRIQEPLSKNYPFKEGHNFLGNLIIASGQPNFKNYSFKEKIKDNSFEISKEIRYAYTQQVLSDETKKRFYFGGIGSFYTATQKYLLESQSAEQSYQRLSFGPYAQYFLFDTKEYSLSLNTAVEITVFDEISLKITNSNETEERVYTNRFSPIANFGIDFNKKKAFYDFDIGLGANSRITFPRTYLASKPATNTTMWNDISNSDQLQQDLRIEISYYLSITSRY